MSSEVPSSQPKTERTSSGISQILAIDTGSLFPDAFGSSNAIVVLINISDGTIVIYIFIEPEKKSVGDFRGSNHGDARC